MTDWHRGEFVISTDKTRLDIATIHDFLSNRSYWALGRPRHVTERAIENSLCFGVYAGFKLIGFARVVTDFAVFAYIGDVFILEEWRGHGLSKWLMQTIVGHPDLQNLRRWILTTKDAHSLYEQTGFTALRDPSRFMERFTDVPNYKTTEAGAK